MVFGLKRWWVCPNYMNMTEPQFESLKMLLGGEETAFGQDIRMRDWLREIYPTVAGILVASTRRSPPPQSLLVAQLRNSSCFNSHTVRPPLLTTRACLCVCVHVCLCAWVLGLLQFKRRCTRPG